MKRLLVIALLMSFIALPLYAQSENYIVKPGDSMWKIAVKYEIGLSELAKANPQIKNISLIYPEQKITIPNIGSVKALEDEVIRLVNLERSDRGLEKLVKNWELSRVARYKSQDMINKSYFAHQSPTYGSPFRMMESFGIRFSAGAENIAYGLDDPSGSDECLDELSGS